MSELNEAGVDAAADAIVEGLRAGIGARRIAEEAIKQYLQAASLPVPVQGGEGEYAAHIAADRAKPLEEQLRLITGVTPYHLRNVPTAAAARLEAVRAETIVTDEMGRALIAKWRATFPGDRGWPPLALAKELLEAALTDPLPAHETNA